MIQTQIFSLGRSFVESNLPINLSITTPVHRLMTVTFDIFLKFNRLLVSVLFFVMFGDETLENDFH